MQHAQIGAVFGQQFNQMGVVGQHVHRPALDVCEHARVEVLGLLRDAGSVGTRANYVRSPARGSGEGLQLAFGGGAALRPAQLQ